jgi:ribosome-binding factor A
MSIRTERVASLIKAEIGEIVTREYNEPSYGFITVTDVRMTPDLRIAKVSFSIFGSEEQKQRTMTMLDEERGHIRGIVGSHLRLKFTPSLQFYRDDTLDTADRINQLIKKLHEDDNGRDGEQS